MGKGTIKTKAMTMAVAMSMVAGLCPSTVFAANSEDVAKVQDGTYTGKAKCSPNRKNQFDEYELSLKVTIENGKIVSIDNVNGNGDADNDDYISDAVNGYDEYESVVKQIVDANGTDGINAVSGATCSSNAIVDAVNNALEGATKKEENTVKTDGLQTAITKAESLTENDYGADSWKSMQDALTAAKDALEKKESQTAVDTATTELTKAIDALVPKTPDAQKEVYVLMNIPYADFYKADGVTGADTVSSATKQKTRASLASGSYHVNSDGSDITGVTFPVKISDGSVLEKYTQVTDESEVTITTNIKGKENTVTYKGQDALFESASYSYYTLSDTPSYYKEATVNEDGSLSFSEVKGEEPTTLTNAKTEFSTSLKYGDYQLDITSDDLKNVNTVYGVVVSTKEGSSYGLRHVENIWKKTKLAWSTGFVTESHGNTLDSKDYASMMGQTINKVTYYTDAGIYEIPMNQKVQTKYDGEISVADASVNAENTIITVSGLPSDFAEEYTINGLDADTYSVEIKSDGKTTTRTINFKKALAKGRYTVTLSDKNGNYAPISTTFNVYTETMPVKYNEDDKNPAVVKNDDVEEEEFQTYLKSITSVTVNGKEYAASGKKVVKLIKEDGKLDLEQDVFKDAKAGDAFAVTIAEDGYQPYTFTYKVPGEDSKYSYVYVGMSWAEYWANEGVYNAGSIEASDVKDSRDEYDKGAFDTVTRATTNHGLHRGSFQCTAVIEDTEGEKHYLSHWEGKDQAVMTDGTTYTYAKGVFTAKNGSSFTQKDYEVTGLKYVPVKVRTADLDSLKVKYTVVENGGELIGGYGENQLKSYKTIADVTANTNGLKTAEKQEDGSFAFSARTTGSYSGLKDTQLATADVTPDVKAGDKVGSYGEFIRVDFNGNYGGLGSAMQAVEWTYYGNDDTYTNPVRVFGTKFASDNWMHKSMGIQLGLTDSLRCQLPENTNGTGYWKITIYGLGYADYSYNFEVGTENIATLKTASAEEIAALQAKIDEAKALNRFAYTTDSWKKMQDELEESEDLLKSENPLKSEVNEQIKHLTDAIDSLVKVQYVLMNIPYAEFYKAETTNNDIPVDAFTSATMNKTRTKGLAGGSYHENADGSKIDGITYAVKVTSSVDLSKYKKVSDDDSVSITVTNRGQTTTTKDMPAAYDEENKKLVEAEGFDIDALKAYLGNITSVNVNGKDYAASGRGSVVIINKDGTIKTDADPFKDAVAGTEFQITVASTGYTTPLTFTYKIAETPAPAEVDTTALEAAIAEADNLKEADYTAESWSVYQAALQSARTALEAKESQDAVDQALAALNAAKDALVKAEEEPVAINTASLEKAIADAKALKEADYTADSWKALQSALSDAQKALEAKESQEAVDNATNSLNKAIKALVKKGSSSVKKTDGTTNGSKTSGNDSVKTGDPASVLGWLGLAVSSLGAGMGGFAWKRRKRK